MAALTNDRNTPRRDGDVFEVPVAAATLIYAGAMVARDADGNAVAAADTAGLVVIGRAEVRADNSAGADGAISVTVRRGVFAWSHSGLTRADLGKVLYATDDQTVATTSTNKAPAGILVDVDSDGAWVKVGVDAVIDRVAAHQANSTATDVAGVVTDFNALLAKLIAAGLMA